MKMKASSIVLFAATAIASTSLASQDETIYGPGCGIQWDYSAEDQARIVGFPIEVNGQWIKRLPPEQREIACSELPLVEGSNTFRIRAVSLDGSQRSDWAELVFPYAIPVAVPGGLRMVLEWGAQVQ
jgi:hypothetical protein